ncbi:ribonuclease HII [archaeon]|nr:ribonuclease HII [archaeon]|tara:strand:- start:1151 stop:1795 length:645 start_codon:yes stop_codon:yes gene_type:complete
MILGIDEAGRGPIIGPLVIAGALIEESNIPKLEALGARDSKLLTPKKREELFEKIKLSIKKHKIIKILPKEIDEALSSDSLNLNWLEAHKTAEIINSLNPDKAIIDSPSPNLNAYKNYIYELLKNKDIELIVEHKAEKYPIVAAASILAKVTRDREIEIIKKKYGNCGPGYTSNETTQKFIKENFEKHPEIFRKTWSTYKKLVSGKKQKKLGEF